MDGLEQVLSSHRFILTDSEIDPTQSNWYWDHFYPNKHHFQFDSTILKRIIWRGVEYLEWIAHPRVNTVRGIVVERRQIRDILRDKLRNINENDSIREENGRMTDDQRERGMTRKALFEELTFLYHHIARIAHKSQFRAENPEFMKSFEELIVDIANGTGAKRDFNVRIKKHDEPSFSKADEELVATALYRSLILREATNIVSADSDIYRILMATVMYGSLTSDQMRIRCIQNPVSVDFITRQGDFRPVYSTEQKTQESFYRTISRNPSRNLIEKCKAFFSKYEKEIV